MNNYELTQPSTVNESLQEELDPKTGNPIYAYVEADKILPEFRGRIKGRIQQAKLRPSEVLCYRNIRGQWVPEHRNNYKAPSVDTELMSDRIQKALQEPENQGPGVLARAGDAPKLSRALHPKPPVGEAAYSTIITTHRNSKDVHGRAYSPGAEPTPAQDHVEYTRVSMATRLGEALIIKPAKPGYKPEDPANSITPADINTKSTDFKLKFTNAATLMSLNVQAGKWEGQTVPFANIPENPWEIDSHYAEGVFTGKIAYKIEGKRYVFRLSKHMKRLRDNLAALKIDASEEMLRGITCAQLAADDEWIPDAHMNVGNPDGTTQEEVEGLGNRYYGRDVTDSTAYGPGIGGPGVVLTSIGTVVGKYMPPSAKTLKIIMLGARPVNAETAGIKEKGNYRPAMRKLSPYKSKGYHEALFTAEGRLQEGTGCNFIGVRYGTSEDEMPTLLIPNPNTHKDILNGITAESVRELAEHYGYKIEFRDIAVEELASCDEVMATGTAMSIQGIHQIDTELEGVNRPVFQSKFGAEVGPVTKRLADDLKRILRKEHPEQRFNDWMELA